ncbi:MAG: VCBS domain-containing protein, partial [Bilophila sp.]
HLVATEPPSGHDIPGSTTGNPPATDNPPAILNPPATGNPPPLPDVPNVPGTGDPEKQEVPGPSVDSFRDVVTEDQESVLNGTVLAHSTPGKEPSTLLWTSAPASAFGVVRLNPDGTYRYQLDNTLQKVQALSEGEHAEEHFTYTYTDAQGLQATGVLTIIINGANDAPTVAASTALMTEDAPSLR